MNTRRMLLHVPPYSFHMRHEGPTVFWRTQDEVPNCVFYFLRVLLRSLFCCHLDQVVQIVKELFKIVTWNFSIL